MSQQNSIPEGDDCGQGSDSADTENTNLEVKQADTKETIDINEKESLIRDNDATDTMSENNDPKICEQETELDDDNTTLQSQDLNRTKSENNDLDAIASTNNSSHVEDNAKTGDYSEVPEISNEEGSLYNGNDANDKSVDDQDNREESDNEEENEEESAERENFQNMENDYESDGLYDEEILAAMQLSMNDVNGGQNENSFLHNKSKGKSKEKEKNRTSKLSGVENESEDENDQSNEDYFLGNSEEGEIAMDGEPVEVEYPFDIDNGDAENPLDEEDEEYMDALDQKDYSEDSYDPLNGGGDGIGVDENTSDFLEQVNSGFISQSVQGSGGYVKQIRAKRGPYKKTRIRLGLEDFDSSKKGRIRNPSSGPEVYFNCSICSFPFDTLGELKIHMYGDHENQDKPNYLDLTEAAISKLNRKGGTSKILIIQEILSDPSVTETPEKARKLLDKAIKAGLERGRLRSGQPGKKGCKSYWLVGRAQRRELLAKYMANKNSVDYNDQEKTRAEPEKVNVRQRVPVRQNVCKPSPFEGIQITPMTPKTSLEPPDPQKFGRGKRKPKPIPKGFEVTLESSSSSDEEIAIISEKITPKTQFKLMQLKKIHQQNMMAKMGQRRPVKNGMSSAKRVFKKVPVLGNNVAKKAEKEEEVDFFADDDDLSCKLCVSTFWYKTEILAHLKADHNIDDPESFLREKKTSL